MRPGVRRLFSLFVPVVATVSVATSGQPLHAQQLGSIRGRVMVEGANRPLGAAQVSVVGTQIGTQTNDNSPVPRSFLPPTPPPI